MKNTSLVLADSNVKLHELTLEQADAFFNIYANLQVQASLSTNVFLPNETAVAFTKRITSLCNFIFTIRPTADSDLIIGDCALHHYNYNKDLKAVEIGGLLLPQYWGKGYMQSAYKLLMNYALLHLNVKTISAKTTFNNAKALCFLHKMKFEKTGSDGVEVKFQYILPF